MIDILITNGRVIDPASGRDEIANVAISNGFVTKIGRAAPKAHQTIDASEMIVSPGLIDLHAHCREPGHEEEETIATAAASAVAGGFSTICAMPNTHPPQDDETSILYVLQRMARAGKARVLPAGCITKQREGKELAEMGMMLEAGAVAFTDDGTGVASTIVMQRALQYAKMIGVVLMQHCQDPDLFGGVMNSGAVAVRLGLPGIAASGEEIMLRRDLELVKRTGARYHAMHLSSAGSVEIIRQAKAEGLPVTAEAAPHHLLLTDAACMGYDPNYKMNPPLRSASDVEALRLGVADGTIDCLATDHAPHAQEEKEMEFALAPFGIVSLDCALGLYTKALIHSGLMDWPEMLARLTVNPAKIIAPTLGLLQKDAPADITIIDPKKRWTVNVNKFASKGRNCPYHGWKLKSKAVTTIVGGEVKFQL
ncbi:MAG: dihydroorotase [Phycisphaerales bacterium]|jgi:dihydroorotase|nr:dihydroorotase [Phycisphaerales bacterium]